MDVGAGGEGCDGSATGGWGAVRNREQGHDLFEDPHFKERGFFETTDHASVGEYSHFGMPFKMSKTPGGSHAPAPQYAQHNRRVFCDMLGLGEEEYAGLLGTRVSAEAPLIGD